MTRSARPTLRLAALPLAALMALAGCATPPAPQDRVAARAPAVLPPVNLPPMKRFGTYHPTPVNLSNVDIANDFLDLSFTLESGRDLPWMTRFEGPVSVTMQGDIPPTAPQDLDALLARLRTEAHIPVRRTQGPANITIHFLPRAEMQREVPEAACFVAPRVASWGEYVRARGGPTVSWATLRERERLAVFIPSDTSPQEIRDCLHEEVAQALGPLDDLYRLTDSVFDDDNYHSVLTGFDMLILRAYYSPELPSGTTRAEAARRLPAILARLNPRGQTIAAGPLPTPTPRDWIRAIEGALGPRYSDAQRQRSAARALDIARAEGWQGPRLAFSLFVLGRLDRVADPDRALAALKTAEAIYLRLPNTAVQRAHIDTQLAAYALAARSPDTALKLIGSARPVAERAQNAALLATLDLMRADALMMKGDAKAARAARLDSIGWARYGFGTERAIRQRMEQIASLDG